MSPTSISLTVSTKRPKLLFPPTLSKILFRSTTRVQLHQLTRNQYLSKTAFGTTVCRDTYCRRIGSFQIFHTLFETTFSPRRETTHLPYNCKPRTSYRAVATKLSQFSSTRRTRVALHLSIITLRHSSHTHPYTTCTWPGTHGGVTPLLTSTSTPSPSPSLPNLLEST